MSRFIAANGDTCILTEDGTLYRSSNGMSWSKSVTQPDCRRTARTLEEAFGVGAKLDTHETESPHLPVWMEWAVTILCVVGLCLLSWALQ
jgi:hypothetical protein